MLEVARHANAAQVRRDRVDHVLVDVRAVQEFRQDRFGRSVRRRLDTLHLLGHVADAVPPRLWPRLVDPARGSLLPLRHPAERADGR